MKQGQRSSKWEPSLDEMLDMSWVSKDTNTPDNAPERRRNLSAPYKADTSRLGKEDSKIPFQPSVSDVTDQRPHTSRYSESDKEESEVATKNDRRQKYLKTMSRWREQYQKSSLVERRRRNENESPEPNPTVRNRNDRLHRRRTSHRGELDFARRSKTEKRGSRACVPSFAEEEPVSQVVEKQEKLLRTLSPKVYLIDSDDQESSRSPCSNKAPVFPEIESLDVTHSRENSESVFSPIVGKQARHSSYTRVIDHDDYDSSTSVWIDKLVDESSGSFSSEKSKEVVTSGECECSSDEYDDDHTEYTTKSAAQRKPKSEVLQDSHERRRLRKKTTKLPWKSSKSTKRRVCSFASKGKTCDKDTARGGKSRKSSANAGSFEKKLCSSTESARSSPPTDNGENNSTIVARKDIADMAIRVDEVRNLLKENRRMKSQVIREESEKQKIIEDFIFNLKLVDERDQCLKEAESLISASATREQNMSDRIGQLEQILEKTSLCLSDLQRNRQEEAKSHQEALQELEKKALAERSEKSEVMAHLQECTTEKNKLVAQREEEWRLEKLEIEKKWQEEVSKVRHQWETEVDTLRGRILRMENQLRAENVSSRDSSTYTKVAPPPARPKPSHPRLRRHLLTEKDAALYNDN